MTRSFENGSYVIPILRQCTETKITRNAVKIPNLGFGFEEAGHDFSRLFLEIGVVAWIADNRHAPFHSVKRFGHDVEVLAGLKGYVDANRFCEMPCPHPCCHDNRLGEHGLTILSFHTDTGIAVFKESLHRDSLNDGGPTTASAFDQCHCRVDR